MDEQHDGAERQVDGPEGGSSAPPERAPSTSSGANDLRLADDPESLEMDPHMTISALRDHVRRWRRS